MEQWAYWNKQHPKLRNSLPISTAGSIRSQPCSIMLVWVPPAWSLVRRRWSSLLPHLIHHLLCHGRERKWRERKKSTCYRAIPINDQTSDRKRGQFITFDEAKSWEQKVHQQRQHTMNEGGKLHCVCITFSLQCACASFGPIGQDGGNVNCKWGSCNAALQFASFATWHEQC